MSLLSGFLQKVNKPKDFSSPSDPKGTLYKHIEKKSINHSNLGKDLGLLLDPDTASVETVAANSIAANSGISSGYFIYHVNGQFVETAEEVQRVVSQPTLGIDLKLLPREGIDQLLRKYNESPELDVDFSGYATKEPILYGFLNGVHPLHERWRKKLEGFRRIKQTSIEIKREREQRAMAELERALHADPTPAPQPQVAVVAVAPAKPSQPPHLMGGGHAAGVPLNQSVVAADLFNTDHVSVGNNSMFQQGGNDDVLMSMLMAHGGGPASKLASATDLHTNTSSGVPNIQAHDGATDAQLLMLLQQQQMISNSGNASAAAGGGGPNGVLSPASIFTTPSNTVEDMQPKYSDAVVMAKSPNSATENRFPSQVSPQVTFSIVPEAVYLLSDGTSVRVVVLHRNGPLPQAPPGDPAEAIKAHHQERRRERQEKRKQDRKATDSSFKAVPSGPLGGNPHAAKPCYDYDYKGHCSRGSACRFRHDPQPSPNVGGSSRNVNKRDPSPDRNNNNNNKRRDRSRDRQNDRNSRNDYHRRDDHDDRDYRRDKSRDRKRDRSESRDRDWRRNNDHRDSYHKGDHHNKYNNGRKEIGGNHHSSFKPKPTPAAATAVTAIEQPVRRRL